jgi:hypothetical protein
VRALVKATLFLLPALLLAGCTGSGTFGPKLDTGMQIDDAVAAGLLLPRPADYLLSADVNGNGRWDLEEDLNGNDVQDFREQGWRGVVTLTNGQRYAFR